MPFIFSGSAGRIEKSERLVMSAGECNDKTTYILDDSSSGDSCDSCIGNGRFSADLFQGEEPGYSVCDRG